MVPFALVLFQQEHHCFLLSQSAHAESTKYEADVTAGVNYHRSIAEMSDGKKTQAMTVRIRQISKP